MKHKTAAFVPILLIVVYVLLALSGLLTQTVQDVSSNAFLSVTIVQFLVLLVPFAFYCGIRRKALFRAVPMGLPAGRDVPLILYALGVYLFGAATLKFLTCAAFSSAAAHTSALITVSLYTANTPLVILCFILLPAFLEQVLFSGLVVQEYLPFGGVIAVTVSALTYAMAHFSFENLPFYFFCGLITAALTCVTKTALPAILISAVSLALDVYLEDLFFEYVTQTGTNSVLFFFFCGLFLFFLTLSVAHLERSYSRRARSARESARAALEEARGEKKPAEEEAMSFWKRFRLAFLSPVFVLLIAVFILLASGIL